MIDKLTIRDLERLGAAVALVAQQHGLRSTLVKIRIYKGGEVNSQGRFKAMGYCPDLNQIVFWDAGCLRYENMAEQALLKHIATHPNTKHSLSDLRRLSNGALRSAFGEKLAHEVCHMIDYQNYPKLAAFCGRIANLKKDPSLRDKRWLRPLLWTLYYLSPFEIRARAFGRRHKETYAEALKTVLR